MHFRLNKYLIEQSIRFLRRLLSYNNQWSNKDIEIIQLSSGSSNMVFEQFFSEAEKYPIITVSTAGGNYTQSAFNDLIRVVDNDTIKLGVRSLKTVTISDVNELQVIVPYTVNETLRGIDVNYAWTGVGVGGSDIIVNVYKNFTTTPILIGSGSLPGTTSTELKTYFTEFNDNILLDGTDFAITFITSSGSSYYISIDNTSVNNYIFNENGNITYSSGSIVGNLYLPAFVRIGTDFQPTLNFKVQAKNDTSSLYNLSELIVMYFTLAKYGQISRTTDSINGITLSSFEIDSAVSEFLEKGIYIKSIRQGGLEVRRRGEKDIVFGITISIDMFTEWFEDYPLETLKSINVDANSFLSNLQNN